MDGAGENKKMKATIKRAHKNIDVEFTARDTPEQNKKLERTIATIWNGAQAMFDAAGTEGEMRERLWAEASKQQWICGM